MKESTKRKRRTKSDIEECIEKAAIELIEEDGFLKLAVTAITKKAKIEPVVFYNRYNNLDEFINEFVKKYDYWFSDIAKKYIRSSNKEAKYRELLQSLLKSLKGNKVMQQLLRWELAMNNEMTQRTAQFREVHTLPLAKEYKKVFLGSNVDILAISALMIGGIYYLVLHSDLATFSKIDINTTEGEERICKAIDYLSDMLFKECSAKAEIIRIAQKMKTHDIAIEIISDCTELPIEVIKNI